MSSPPPKNRGYNYMKSIPSATSFTKRYLPPSLSSIDAKEHALEIPKTISPKQILHPQTIAFVQKQNLQTFVEIEANIRHPNSETTVYSDYRIIGQNGMHSLGAKSYCEKGGGGVLFVGVSTQPNGSIVGLGSFGFSIDCRKSGGGRLRYIVRGVQA